MVHIIALPPPFDAWRAEVSFRDNSEFMAVRLSSARESYGLTWNGVRLGHNAAREKLLRSDLKLHRALNHTLPDANSLAVLFPSAARRILNISSVYSYVCDVGEIDGQLWHLDVSPHDSPPGLYEGEDHWLNLHVWSKHTNDRYSLGWNGRRLSRNNSTERLTLKPKLYEAVLKLLAELYPPQDDATTAKLNMRIWALAEGLVSRF